LAFTASATQPAVPGSASNPYPLSCSPGSGSNVTLNGVMPVTYAFVVTSPVCYLSVAPGAQSSEPMMGSLPASIASGPPQFAPALGVPLYQGTSVFVEVNEGGSSTFTVNASPTLGGSVVSSATFVTSAG
jgi:hypothetical protein